MELSKALQTAFDKFQDVLTFLDKVKDKKLRKNKEELIVSIRVFLQLNEKLLPQPGESAAPEEDSDLYLDTVELKNQDDQETYNDVAVQEENYNDVVVVGQDEDTQVYNDTELDDPPIYDDNLEDVKPPLPAQNAAVIPPTAAEELTSASHADFLEMKREEKSLIKGAWQKRWCVIQGNIFYMFESSSDKKQKDAIELNRHVMNIRDDVTKEAKRKERCFELKNNATGKAYEFCASDKESVSKWKLHTEQGSTAGPISLHRQSIPDSPSISVSPGKKKGNIFSVLKKKTKSKDTTSDTTSYKSDDGQTYMDTAVVNAPNGSGGSNNFVQDGEAVYDDTDGAQDVYDDIDRAPEEVKPPSRDRIPSSATIMPLPAAPGGGPTRGFLPPTPGGPEDFGSNSTPNIPPRQNNDNRSARNDVLPPPPSKDIDRESGSGVFSPKQTLPSIPQETERFAPPPTIPIKNMQENGFVDDDDDEEYKETDTSELYQGMWDCPADETNELSFNRGQIVHIISKEYDQYGWWIAKRRDEVGFVPKGYLMQAYEI